MERLGRDCRAEVYTKPVGDPATTPVRPLTAAEQNEQRVASLDSLEKGWKQRVSLAYRDTANGAALDPDFQEDAS